MSLRFLNFILYLVNSVSMTHVWMSTGCYPIDRMFAAFVYMVMSTVWGLQLSGFWMWLEIGILAVSVIGVIVYSARFFIVQEGRNASLHYCEPEHNLSMAWQRIGIFDHWEPFRSQTNFWVESNCFKLIGYWTEHSPYPLNVTFPWNKTTFQY